MPTPESYDSLTFVSFGASVVGPMKLVSEASSSKHKMQPTSPNPYGLQRTPGFGVQLPSAALIRPAQSRAVRPAMKPGTARAFASRRRAHTRAPRSWSLSLGSLGDSSRIL